MILVKGPAMNQAEHNDAAVKEEPPSDGRSFFHLLFSNAIMPQSRVSNSLCQPPNMAGWLLMSRLFKGSGDVLFSTCVCVCGRVHACLCLTCHQKTEQKILCLSPADGWGLVYTAQGDFFSRTGKKILEMPEPL